ncbi:BQ5605_C008g05149 [Microbotryum silenes-dioicae]|uniref:BQ5605_C008g05149 protein n=1 Tax=Microbotryum silenes-dioicae TaxID=796604 RepID=A0A2X0PDY1_9BASI|nr:BQ5605_C008g05149 [Microbotryum silenes-dioicae]
MYASLHSLFFVALSAATMIAADGTPNGDGSNASIPLCGITCAQQVAPQTECKNLTNIPCQCSDSAYRSLILTCLDTQCSLSQDKQDAIDSGKKFCLDQGQCANGHPRMGRFGRWKAAIKLETEQWSCCFPSLYHIMASGFGTGQASNGSGPSVGGGPGQASNGSGPSVGGGPTHGNNITSGGGSASGSGGSGGSGASGSGGSGASGSGASGASGSSNGGSSMGGSSSDNGGKSSAGPSSKGAIRLVASLGAVAVAFAVLV